MRRNALAGLAAALVILAVPFLSVTFLSVPPLLAPVAAHHGDADRYNPEVVTVTGTVVELQMVNPHARIVLDVDEGGKTVRWQAELGGPQQVIKQFGWTPSTLKKGTKITMIGRRLKSGSPYLNLTERANIVLTDGGKEIYRTTNFGEPAPVGPKGTLATGATPN